MSRRKQKVDELDEPVPSLRGTGRVSKLANLAAEVGGEDGGDPKEFHAKPWDAPKQASRKGQQLCAQVKRALHGTLADCADVELQALHVVSVEPAPHTGRLRVLLAADGDHATAKAAMTRAAGFLRAEVALTVSRRNVPELVFEIV